MLQSGHPLQRQAMTARKDPIPRENEVSRIYDAAAKRARINFFAFNTAVSIDVYGEQELADVGLASALDACRGFERLFSRTLLHSDVSRINNATGALVEIAPETARVIAQGILFSEASGGTFDITMGSVTRLWDFKNGKIPDAAAIRSALVHVGYRNIDLMNVGGVCFARLRDPLAAIDLGGIAKGYIADRLARQLLDCGLDAFFINLGGNVLVHGRKPDGSRWRVGVKDPVNPGSILGSIEVENCAVVTSGTYDRCFLRDGTVYHHILNPRTGYPVASDIVSATVICRKATDAEGYSTTLLALGNASATAMVEESNCILQAIFVDGDNKVSYAYGIQG